MTDEKPGAGAGAGAGKAESSDEAPSETKLKATGPRRYSLPRWLAEESTLTGPSVPSAEVVLDEAMSRAKGCLSSGVANSGAGALVPGWCIAAPPGHGSERTKDRGTEKPVKIDAAGRRVANRPAALSGRNRRQTSAAELCSHLLWSIPPER